MREENYRDQKDITVPLDELFNCVARDYQLGEVAKYSKIEIGYEDNNFILETSFGKYMIKVFGNYRDEKECRRYISILEAVQSAGVSSPKLYKHQDKSLYNYQTVRLAVFEFVNGKNYFELEVEPNSEDVKEIIRQAAIINRIDLKPDFVYDDWAIVNFIEQYNIVLPHLKPDEKASLETIKADFEKINLDDLPHAFVHGDIIATNVMKNSSGKIFIIDFACSNYVPRIIELAVMACNLLVTVLQSKILAEYEKYNPLEPEERDLFPLFVKLAHAMHIIGAVRERDIYGNTSIENEYWLNQGRKGLGLII